MLEIAIGVTGADGGSLMLTDPGSEEFRVRFAIGIEEELWGKIRIAAGEGIAGAVVRDGRSLVLRGPADPQRFPGAKPRRDVECSLCVPLVDEGATLGVLNLRHSTRRDVFDDEDVEFVEQLAALDAQIIARAQQHERLRDRAARYTTAHDIRELLSGSEPLLERLRRFCLYCAKRCGGGIATLYLSDRDEGTLRMTATSLAGGGYGGEYQITLGEGIDGRAAAQGESVLLRDPSGALAYAALPLVAEEDRELVGLLTLQMGAANEDSESPSSESLQEIAHSIGEGIAAIHREEQNAARATKLSAINEAGIQMLSAESLSEVVRLATSSIALILDAEHVVLRLRDAKTRRFVIRSYFGPADGRQQEELFRCDKDASLEVLNRGESLLVRNVRRTSASEPIPQRKRQRSGRVR